MESASIPSQMLQTLTSNPIWVDGIKLQEPPLGPRQDASQSYNLSLQVIRSDLKQMRLCRILFERMVWQHAGMVSLLTSMQDNGTVNVFNSCELDGRQIPIRGTATPVDAVYGEAGVFRVQFPGTPPEGKGRLVP